MLAILDANASLTLVMSGAANTTNPSYSCTFGGLMQAGDLNGTTAVTVAPAPSSGHTIVDRLSVYNADDASVTITLARDSVNLAKYTLAAGDHLYLDSTGAKIIDASGQRKSSSSGGQIFANTGLKIYDTSGDHTTTLKQNSNEAADRTVNLPALGADGTLALIGLAQTFTAAQTFDNLIYNTEARTATADGLTTGTITDAGMLNFITVTASDANHIIVLPTPTPGTIVILHVGANGFELRTDTPASVSINGGSGASAESAIPANTMVLAVCTTATTWQAIDLTGTTLAAVEAAA